MLKVFNTLTREKEEFVPLDENRVRMYVCGITVYDYCHLGHARMLVAFDVIARWLRQCGYDLTYVRNITDIDDKILQRSLDSGRAYADITEEFIALMHEDEQALNIQAPDIEPRATEYISEMKTMIAGLIDNGSAYAVENGDVYFSIKSFDGYGKLSGKNPDELLDGARVQAGELKKDPRDFALWKGANANEPEEAKFQADWGLGRPGWHIECSVMSTANLGESFDIHGGGQDLVFPHHENEIAQSEACLHKPYAKYWLHNNSLRVDEVKMSKSLNNFFTIRDILEHHDAEVVRFFLVRSHYRSVINYSADSMDEAAASLERLYLALLDVDSAKGNPDAGSTVEAREQFAAAMNDDFNSAEAMAVLFDLARRLNVAKSSAEASDSALANDLAATLKNLAQVLGLLQREPAEFLQSARPGNAEGLSNEAIQQLVDQRDQAKLDGNYAEADRIRDQLGEQGIQIEDARGGSRWRRK